MAGTQPGHGGMDGSGVGMSTAPLVFAAGRPTVTVQPRRHAWRGALRGPDFTWAIAFAIPYMAIFVAFVLYPICYAFWLGGRPKLYAELADSPIFLGALLNTAIYVGVSVNLKMFMAFLLSGFFMRRRWWIKALLVIFILPWATPALPAFMSIHWMLNGHWGFLNSVLWQLFGIEGPIWLIDRWLALGANIAATIWKQLPFWTVILIRERRGR